MFRKKKQNKKQKKQNKKTKLGISHLGDGQSMQVLSLSLSSSVERVRAAVFVGFGIDDFGKEPSSDCCL